MDPHEVVKFIEAAGHKTMVELTSQFSGQDQEILSNTLTYLTTKNQIRKAKFQGPNGHEELYYIPQK